MPFQFFFIFFVFVCFCFFLCLIQVLRGGGALPTLPQVDHPSGLRPHLAEHRLGPLLGRVLAPSGRQVRSFFIVFLHLMLTFRCMSVAYSPLGRECRISRFDQRDSRILYDPDFDYYENLVGKRHITVLHSMEHSTRSILLTVHPRPPARVHQGGHHISAFPPIHQKWGAHGSSRPHCTRKRWERENLFGRVCSTAQIFSSSKTV